MKKNLQQNLISIKANQVLVHEGKRKGDSLWSEGFVRQVILKPGMKD